MGCSPYSGKWMLKWYPKKASQVLSDGAIVDLTDGYVTVADIAVMSHLGIGQKDVTADDDDYTETTLIPVLIPKSPSCEIKASVLSTDTLAVTHVGTYADLGGSPVGIDVTIATSDDDAVMITRYLGDNLCACVLNSQKFMQSGIGTT